MPQKPFSTLPSSDPLPLSYIIERGRGPRALARALGNITSSAITQWDTKVPVDRAVDVARHTGVPVDRIRPDIWGTEALAEALNAHLTRESA